VRNAWGVSATNVGVWWLAHCVVKPIVAIANQEIVNSVVNFIVEIVHKKYYICVYACLLHITNQTRYQKKGGKHVTCNIQKDDLFIWWHILLIQVLVVTMYV